MDPKRLKIAIGMPVIDSVPGEAIGHHLLTVAEVARHATIAVFTPMNLMPHDRARMEIIEGAFEQGCDYLFFIDDDTIVPKGSFPEMLSVIQATKAVVVTGMYYQRGFPYKPTWSKKIEGVYRNVNASSGVHEIDSAGLGCALIDLAWVKENLSPPYFTMWQDGRSTVVADDASFYLAVREKGGLVLGLGSVRCGHVCARTVACDETVGPLTQMVLAQLTKEANNGPERQRERTKQALHLEQDPDQDGHQAAGQGSDQARGDGRDGSEANRSDAESRSPGDQHGS